MKKIVLDLLSGKEMLVVFWTAAGGQLVPFSAMCPDTFCSYNAWEFLAWEKHQNRNN